MKLRIAIQNKGRLMEGSVKFLRDIGLQFERKRRELLVECEGKDVEILYLRCKDIPTYINQDVVDFGIVGENVLIEGDCKVEVLKKLGFGKCELVLAAPIGVENLEGERFAPSYPNCLKKYLSEKGLNAAIVKIRGSVEAAPALNLADAVCDISQTGRTLEMNGLKVLDKLFDSEAVLVGKSRDKWDQLTKVL